MDFFHLRMMPNEVPKEMGDGTEERVTASTRFVLSLGMYKWSSCLGVGRNHDRNVVLYRAQTAIFGVHKKIHRLSASALADSVSCLMRRSQLTRPFLCSVGY